MSEMFYCEPCDMMNVKPLCECCGEPAKSQGELIDEAELIFVDR